jgi:heme exporter protein D
MIPAAVEGMGRSVEYRKTWGWTAIQIGWGAFAALLIALVLILVTGVYHRRHKRQIAATQATQNVQDYHNVSEKGSI